MSLARIFQLLEEAAENATGLCGSVTVRARLAVGRTALADSRLDDAAEHLRVAFDAARREEVSTPIGNARQLLQIACMQGGRSP